MKILEVRGDAKRIILQFDKVVDPSEAKKVTNYKIGDKHPLSVRITGGFVILSMNEMSKPAVDVSISDLIKDKEGNSLRTSGLTFKYKPKYRNREIRVSAVQPLGNKEVSSDFGDYMDYILNLVDKAGRMGSDIVCIPESIQSQFGKSMEEHPCTGINEFANLFKEKAKKYKMYVLVHAKEKIGKNFRNVEVLINRTGQISGRYQKLFVTETSPVIPGLSAPVFETDFGKIGIIICFDAYFPELSTLLGLKGAEILFNPHAVDAGEESNLLMLRARAHDNCVYLVSSGYGRKVDRDYGHFGRSCIIDYNGLVIADAGYKDGIVSALIDLENKKLVYGYGGGWESGPLDARQRITREMRPDIAGLLYKEMCKQAKKMWFVERGYWKKH